MNTISNTEGKDLLFHAYRPVHIVVGKNKNKINGILNQDFYLNGWIKNFSIEKNEFNGIKNISISNNNMYAFVDYKKINKGYIICKLYNKANVLGLGVVLINMLKKELKEGEYLILKNDVARYKEGEKRNKEYYIKQGFERYGFSNNLCYKKNNMNTFLKFKYLLKEILGSHI